MNRVRPALEFAGRVALITGAAGSIGSAVAQHLHAAGADVYLADLNSPFELATRLTESGPGRAIPCKLDVRNAEEVRTFFDQMVSETGRLDFLVTVAGVTSLGSFESISDAEWDRVHTINLRGVFLCNQAAIKPMKAAGYGRIVNLGSVLAKNGGNPRPWIDPAEQRGGGNAAYGASKAGVHALTLYLAKELADHSITVNAVAPGPVQGPMTATLPEALVGQIPVGRLGSGVEIAHAVAFLCSERSSFITGEILDVNGGLWGD